VPTSAITGLHHIEQGAGEALLLVSGARHAVEAWGAQVAAFAATHRVIAAALPEGPASDGAARLSHLMDALGIPAATLVAHGSAAAAAMELAAQHPQRVKRLALFNAPEGEEVGAILCPTLFVSGGAAEVPRHALRRARSEVIAGGGHELPFTHAAEAKALIASLLAERLSSFDSRELRSAFGTFMTGVTIVTTTGPDGGPRGFTANSFTSVSLEPVNILSEAQKDTSALFASKRADKFTAAAWRHGPFGSPLIEGSAAWFDCARYRMIDAGDHVILMGHVEAFSYSDANPLGYARGHYITLGLEQAAVNAASSASRTVVGAILENDNRLVLLPDPARPNGLSLPEVGRSGQGGSASQLHALLQREGLDATLGFLFAVFENPGTREQCIYYRGEALLHARGRTVLADFDAIPWDRLPDEATRSMLKRYAEERKIGRFRVYSGDHRQGTIKAVD